jgi:exoribonuclease R
MASKKLVEEYMLLANVHVACFLREWVQDKTLLRVHEEVNQTNQGVLEAFYKKLGVDVDTSSSLTFSKSIEALQTSYPIKFSVVIKKFMTALKAAKYMCINDFADEFLRHYGLSLDLYTHFTSPIRRYADLLVHRLVTVCLEYKDQARKAIEHMDYSSYADLCSEKSLNARTASKEC